MIVEKKISLIRMLAIVWKRLLSMTILSSIIIVPMIYFDKSEYAIDLNPALILGTAIAIFLGFRTNSAYDRWFSARKSWGDMRAASRNMALVMARNGEAYTNKNTGKPSKIAAKIMPEMIRRNIAWLWVLGRQLKGLPPLQGVEHLLSKPDLKAIKASHNPALKLLFLQSRDFRVAQSEGQFYDGEHFEIVACHREMISGQTSCEGLRNTPFPAHYTYFTHVFIWIFIMLLALALPGIDKLNYFAIPAIVMLGWVFFTVEGIGRYMDDPFVNNRNVVPMDALARSLEIDLKAIALEEADIPEQIQPIEGALY